jgi:uncharacterized membrane protein
MTRLDLIALGYERVSVATGAAKTLRDLANEGALALKDVAVVVKDGDGHVELKQEESLTTGDGLISGGTIGLLIGLPFGLPVAVSVIGMLGGGAFSFVDRGVSDDKMRSFGASLSPGHSALFALVSHADWTMVRERLRPYDGAIVASEVSAEVAEELGP